MIMGVAVIGILIMVIALVSISMEVSRMLKIQKEGLSVLERISVNLEKIGEGETK